MIETEEIAVTETGDKARRRKRKPSGRGRGHLFKSSGVWYVRYREKRFENGMLKIVQVAKPVVPVSAEFRSRLDVQPLADELLAPLLERKFNPKSLMTLAEFVEQVYFVNAKDTKRASTLKGDNARWKTLKAYCGSKRLREFEVADGQEVLRRLEKDTKLSTSSLRQMKSLLSAIFKHARQQNYIDSPNPMRDAVVPKREIAKGHDEEHTFYTLEVINRMLTILPEPARTIVGIAAFGGLRRGEINGLRWEDYRDGELHVERSWWEGEISDPKTRMSRAPVPVVTPLAEILNEYKVLSGNPTSGWMFASKSSDTPISLNNLRTRQIMPAFEKAGLEWKGYHAFRRGLATVLYSLGVPDKIIQRILRHSSLNVTMASYVKAVPDDVKQQMKKLERAWKRTRAIAVTQAAGATQKPQFVQ